MSHDRTLAVVTGAARGLGAACARTLAGDGFGVFLLDRDEEGLAQTAAELSGNGAEVHAKVIDLLDEHAATAAISQFSETRRIKTLVNVAGLISLGSATDITIEDWDRVVGVKLRGDFIMCRAVIPILAANGGGAIVNISSMSGRTKSVLTAPNYVASNSGVIGLTMTLAAQHAKQNIRVNAIAPGMIQTPLLEAYTAPQLEAIRSAIPMQRFADPAEIASVVSFLVSDKASYITGETINANGGMFMV